VKRKRKVIPEKKITIKEKILEVKNFIEANIETSRCIEEKFAYSKILDYFCDLFNLEKSIDEVITKTPVIKKESREEVLKKARKMFNVK
jgi:L-lysine 2,3-aminomutase